VLAHAEQLQVTSGISFDQAAKLVAELSKTGGLPEVIRSAILVANGKGAGRRDSVSARTLHYWRTRADAKGVTGLADKAVPEAGIPAWAETLLKVRSKASKQSLYAVLEDMPKHLPPGVEMPSYRQAAYFLKKLAPQERERGRIGPRAMKAMRAYVTRTVEGLWPSAVYVADGHTLDAEVINPLTGKPFRPEVTTVLDVFTRRAVGWSAALSENTIGVLDALRHAFTTSALCDIFYVDRGKGFNNAVIDAPLTGFLARAGVQKHTSLPYNSQARGVIERSHQSIWVRGAKGLPSYMGGAMDDEARNRVFKLSRQQIREVGSTPLLPSWEQFCAWADEQVRAYNLRPHSSLPRVRDSETGKLRHLSPDEAWAAARLAGWEPDIIDGAEADDMFRPMEICKTSRGLVRLFTNSYFAIELEAFHGHEVLVGYDVHDAKRVWVRELVRNRDEIAAGRLIAVAEFEGNARSYFPVAYVEQVHQRRVAGRERRAEAKLADIRAEAKPQQVIEHQPASAFEMENLERGAAAMARLAEKAEAPKAEPASKDIEFARRAIAHPETLTPGQRGYAADLCRRAGFRMIAETQGIDLDALRAVSQTQHGEA